MDSTNDRENGSLADRVEDRPGGQMSTTSTMNQSEAGVQSFSNDGDGRRSSDLDQNIEILVNSSLQHETSDPIPPQ